MAALRSRGAALLAAIVAPACIQTGIPPVGGTPREQLSRAEAMYADARDLQFQFEIVEARGEGSSVRGVPLADLRSAHEALRERTLERLEALDVSAFSAADARAIVVMRQALAPVPQTEGAGRGDCAYDPRTVVASGGATALSARMYTCFAASQSSVTTPVGVLDRLTILGRLGTEPDPSLRRELFLALAPVWRSIDGDQGAGSPYRVLAGLRGRSRGERALPSEGAAQELGLEPESLEATLVSVLAAWRGRAGDALVEPWDWFHANDAASRRLAPRVRAGDMQAINDRWYAALGASPRELGIRYDLEPREGKTPVAFTQFGGLPRRTRDGPRGADPRVFATYREGGLGNLAELLHETGHAVHIAAVDTRPAFADWPDSDAFTEGLADVPALEVWEPVWQRRFLGDSATTSESLRGRYAPVMLDVAWALFELRLQREPEADPNATWAGLTRDYLRIAPHPEWSWWAMRGQLVESPGYMMNYAVGAMVAAEVRERIRRERGPLSSGDQRTWEWLSARLYRWGRERTAREVLEAFLGDNLGADALLADIRRM